MAFTDLHVRKLYGALRHAYAPLELSHILYHARRSDLITHRLIKHPFIHYVIENTEADERGKCELITVLLEHGVGFDERYRRQTCIQHAQRSRYRHIETLLGCYYDLFRACRSGDVTSVRELLAAQEVCINVCDDKGITPLHIAAQYGHGELVEFLLSNGAHFDKENDEGLTPLAMATKSHDHKPANVRGTERQWQRRFTHLIFLLSEIEDLFNQVEAGNVNDIRALLYNEVHNQVRTEQQFKLTIRNQFENTVLHEAVRAGHISLTRFFIHECQMSIELEGYMGNPPLIFAVRKYNFPLIKELLSLRANIDGTNKFGDTALFSAVFDGNRDIIQYLIQNGARTDMIGFRGHNLFYEAISREDVGLIKFLYELGVDLEIADNYGKTPLLNAAWDGHFKAFKTFIELGADIRKLCHLGRNIMHFFSRRAEVDWPEELLNIELIETKDAAGHVERTMVTKESPDGFKCPPSIPGLTYQSIQGVGYRLFESVEYFLEQDGAKEAGRLRQLVCDYLDDHPFELSRGGIADETEYRRLIREIREGKGEPNQIQMEAIKKVIEKVLERQIYVISSNGYLQRHMFGMSYNNNVPIFLYQHTDDDFDRHISVDVIEPFDVFLYQDKMSFHEGLKFKSIPGKVNLFSAVAHLVHQDADTLYEQVLDYLERHKDEFARYYSHKDNMDTHIDYLRTRRSAGGFEIEILMRLLDCPIAIIDNSGFARIPTEYHLKKPIPEFDLSTDEGWEAQREYYRETQDPIKAELDKYTHPPIFLYKAGFSITEHYDIFDVATDFNAANIYRELNKNLKHLNPKTQKENSDDVVEFLREQQNPLWSEIPLEVTNRNPPLEGKVSSQKVGDLEYKRILINISDMLLQIAEGKDSRLPMDEAFVREHRDYYLEKRADKDFFEKLTIAEFFHAIAKRNLDYINTFVERFPEKDLSKVLNKKKQSPLHYLIYSSCYSFFRRSEEKDDPKFKEIFDLLITRYSNLDALDKKGNTIVAYAVQLEGWFAEYTITRLKERHVSLTACNDRKQSALQIALEHRASEETVKTLLAHDKNDQLLNELLSQAFSQDYMFKRYGIPRLALLFYDAGRRCSEQYYPRMVFYASIYNRLDILENLYQTNITEIYRDEEGFTALHYANNRQIAEYLIAHGFPLNQQGNSDYQTPLHMFVRSKESDEMIELIRYFIGLKGVDINRQDNRGETALHITILHQRFAMFDALMDAHPNLEVRNNNKQTVLMMAVYRKQTKLVESLCESCANVNVTVDYNTTLLQRILRDVAEYHINCEANANSAYILLKHDAKYEGSEDYLFRTAILAHHDELIECLITKQVAINKEHIELAKSKNLPKKLVERLEKYLGQKDSQGQTVLFAQARTESLPQRRVLEQGSITPEHP